MEYRIEEKIIVSNSEFEIMKLYLTNLKLKKIYNTRMIHSTYFDNINMDLFHLSEEGVVPRKKIRIRKYENSNITGFFLENKIHTYDGRMKNTKKIKNKHVKNYLLNGIYDKEYGQLKPKIQVSYVRDYYIYNDVRITFDKEIRYSKIENPKISIKDLFSVIELKSTNLSLDLGSVPNFSFPRERYSKYCRGINSLFLY